MHFISLYIFNLFSQNYSRTQHLINMQDFAIVKISIDIKEFFFCNHFALIVATV
jgi:hypothetical protein